MCILDLIHIWSQRNREMFAFREMQNMTWKFLCLDLAVAASKLPEAIVELVYWCAFCSLLVLYYVLTYNEALSIGMESQVLAGCWHLAFEEHFIVLTAFACVCLCSCNYILSIEYCMLSLAFRLHVLMLCLQLMWMLHFYVVSALLTKGLLCLPNASVNLH